MNKNSTSLAGEFAVLSQLAIRGHDANMTLGNTKGVDILVSIPDSDRMIRLEVKTTRIKGGNSKIFGKYPYSWMMDKKHEVNTDPKLFYCFVYISKDTQTSQFYIVPSAIVADYVKREHKLWLDADSSHRKNTMRRFRLGVTGEKYSNVRPPMADKYKDNWEFKR